MKTSAMHASRSFGPVACMLLGLAAHSAFAQDEPGAADCTPLAEQYPDLGTEQSVSANRRFTTVWGSFDLPGGPCGYESAEAHRAAR